VRESNAARSRRRTPTRRALVAPGHGGRLALDALAWVVAITVASLLRVDLVLADLEWPGQLIVVPVVVAFHTVSGCLLGLYAHRWRDGSFDEVAALARAAAITTVLVAVVDVLASNPRMVPLGAVFGAGALALVLTGGVRYLTRLRAERSVRPAGDDVQRALVFGAGEGASQLVTAMMRDPSSRYLPVALLDDDPRVQRLEIMGVPVVGTRDDVVEVARRYDATVLIVAIVRADRALLNELTDRARDAGLIIKALPSTRELLDGVARLRDLRDLTPADLLGRREIQTRVENVAGYLDGKRVLVTGAGGSIGAELCRQIRRYAPESLIMLDRDESALHAVQLSIEGRALLQDPGLVLADIRDADVLRRVFEIHRPNVVFHAAALKHLPLLESHPADGIRTNVLATRTLLELSEEFGVERFVNISTDKAANPVSVLGYTKRLAERLTAAIGARTRRPYLSVRFGNVLGSRGSVLDIFQKQILDGGPITVTHPDVTRFFMTIPEACELVLQAGAIGRSGEVLVLDMGEPVRIADVARRLAEMAGSDIEVVFTGLRPGEKLVEVLFGPGESDTRPSHPLIAQVPVPPIEPAATDALTSWTSSERLVRELAGLTRRGLNEAGAWPAPAAAAIRDGQVDREVVGARPTGR
jgi:FlaA1/EpsC-like NDP-sugar epimerase